MPKPMKRTILEKFDVPESNYENVIQHVEIAPQANTGLHTHPGFAAAYLLDGDITVLERGQPSRSDPANLGTFVRALACGKG